MAEKTDLNNWRTYMGLGTVAVEGFELRKLEARWAEEDRRNRYLYKQLWRNAMGTLETLEEAYHAGEMTPGQGAGYGELRSLLRGTLPIVERLGFAPQPVPLEHVQTSIRSDREDGQVPNRVGVANRWRTYVDLWRVTSEASYLPRREARSAEEDKRNRLGYRQEWHYLMGRMENLEEAYRAGRMSPGQEVGYRETKRLLKEVVPILDRLGLNLPLVPLDDA